MHRDRASIWIIQSTAGSVIDSVSAMGVTNTTGGRQRGSNAVSSRTMSDADTALQFDAFWPAQRGEKSPFPDASAHARSGASAAGAKGKSGTLVLIGPFSRMMRLTMPLAGRPEKRFVKAVSRA